MILSQDLSVTMASVKRLLTILLLIADIAETHGELDICINNTCSSLDITRIPIAPTSNMDFREFPFPNMTVCSGSNVTIRCEIDAQRATSTFFTLISNSNIYNICYCNVSNSGEGGTHVTTLTVYAVTAALHGNVFSCVGTFRDKPLQSTMYFRSPYVVLHVDDCSGDESNTTRRTPNVTVTVMDLRSATEYTHETVTVTTDGNSILTTTSDGTSWKIVVGVVVPIGGILILIILFYILP